jgi:hypothetical protein
MLWRGEEAGLGFGMDAEEPRPGREHCVAWGDAQGSGALAESDSAGVAATGVFVDGSQERRVRDDEALEGAMRTVAEEVRSADPDVQRSLPLSPGTHGLEAECLGASSSGRPQKEDRRGRKSREDVKMI